MMYHEWGRGLKGLMPVWTQNDVGRLALHKESSSLRAQSRSFLERDEVGLRLRSN